MNTLLLVCLCIGILIEIAILAVTRAIKRECYDKNCITLGYSVVCGIEILIITNLALFLLETLIIFVL